MLAFPDELRGRWNHNTHYYALCLPFAHGRALDIGCGDGLLLTLLAPRCTSVVGLDASAQMAALAAATCAELANVDVLTGDLLTAPLDDAGFDLVCSYAVIHHLPFEPALRRMAELLRPGGTLVVVGLTNDRAPREWLVGGMAHRVLKRRYGLWSHSAPIADPTMSRREIRTAAARLLPGMRWRRHLLWRYSLIWTRPAPHALRR